MPGEGALQTSPPTTSHSKAEQADSSLLYLDWRCKKWRDNSLPKVWANDLGRQWVQFPGLGSLQKKPLDRMEDTTAEVGLYTGEANGWLRWEGPLGSRGLWLEASNDLCENKRPLGLESGSLHPLDIWVAFSSAYKMCQVKFPKNPGKPQ